MLCAGLAACATPAVNTSPGTGQDDRTPLKPIPVATFASVPVGIAVSHQGRIFLAFSRAIDENQPYSLAELVDGKAIPFPAGVLQDRGEPSAERLLSVQALTVDAQDRLWVLDTAKVGTASITVGAPQLLAIDLSTNHIVRRITFPAEVAGPAAFLNDVVIDLAKGKGGFAFITDSSTNSSNAIVAVDLTTGESKRRLMDHPSTKAEPGFIGKSEGRPLMVIKGPDVGKPWSVGADGIALEADGHHLVFAPTSGHRMHRVSTDALADFATTDVQIAQTMQEIEKGFGSDGLLGDDAGNVYLTDFENNAIHVMGADGQIRPLVKDAALLWPDSMALDDSGNLYVTCTQIERGELFRPKDERKRPFVLWKVPTRSRPLFLGPSAPQASAL